MSKTKSTVKGGRKILHKLSKLQVLLSFLFLESSSKDVLLVGGVGCNRRLQAMMAAMARGRGGACCDMDHRYCVDNGAMIAYAGLCQLQGNARCGEEIPPISETTVTQRFRTDDVLVTWRD